MNTSLRTTKTLRMLLVGCAVISAAACSFNARAPQVAAARYPTASAEAGAAGDAAAGRQARALLGKLPLYFIENRGQENPAVAYYLQGRDSAVYFTRTGVTFALSGPSSDGVSDDRFGADGDEFRHGHGALVRRVSLSERQTRERWTVQLDFVGASPSMPRGEAPTPAVVSYFKGADGESQTALQTYARVVYRDLWPGIDLAYAGTGGQLKYTFVVNPGADPEQIRLAYRGATAVTLTEAGQLAIATPAGGFTDDRPYAYQEGRAGREEVPAAFAVVASAADAQGYGFKVGRYDRTRPLVLDPSVLIYAGFIGGAEEEDARGIAVDQAGNAYVVGSTRSSVPSFPAKIGPDLVFNGGSDDVFVAKVKADGSDLVYLGYIGGAGEDLGRGIAVDKTGSAYVTGITDSDETTFPVKVGPRLTHGGGRDAFVAKINAAGTALVYCGYIGGAGDDDEGRGIAVDGAGNAYVVGTTNSDQTTFPVTVGPDLAFNGVRDAFVAKVKADGTGLLYAGYIGGADDDAGRGIAIDAAGNAFVTGFTSSDQTTFPVKVGPDLTYNGGSADAFVAKVKADGTALVYAGYIGGAADDSGQAIAVDSTGNAYVTGATLSDEATFPVKVGPGLIHAADGGGPEDAFVAKVKADGTGMVYAGFIGGTGNDFGNAIAVDASGSAYIAGSTASDETTFPVKVGPALVFNGLTDAFVAKVRPDGSGLVYAGYVGGADFDAASAIAVDSSGNVYIAGSTFSDQSTFPVTVGPDLIQGGSVDAFVAKLSGKPDLISTAVGVEPGARTPGSPLTFVTGVENVGLGTAKASSTRYYLSIDTVRSANDVLLIGSDSVPGLAPGASHVRLVTVTIPASTPLGSYHVLACADDTKVIAEVDETNNCLASSELIPVALPDLVVTGVSEPPQTVKAGGQFSLFDNTVNVGQLESASSTTRYYLSKDGIKGAGDVLLSPGRPIIPLLPNGQNGNISSGFVVVTIPASIAAGTYRVLACADDLNTVKEASETNNCKASFGAVQVTR